MPQDYQSTTLDVMCHEREDGMGALNYIHPKFISLIAGATMENISEVEKLKRKIRHLEAKVKQLENNTRLDVINNAFGSGKKSL